MFSHRLLKRLTPRPDNSWGLYPDGGKHTVKVGSLRWADLGIGLTVENPYGVPRALVGARVIDPMGEQVAAGIPGLEPVPYHRPTSQVAELLAMQAALQFVLLTNLPCHIMADSAYALGIATGVFNITANHALASYVASLGEAAVFNHGTTFDHVRGHRGLPGNELADFAATPKTPALCFNSIEEAARIALVDQREMALLQPVLAAEDVFTGVHAPTFRRTAVGALMTANAGHGTYQHNIQGVQFARLRLGLRNGVMVAAENVDANGLATAFTIRGHRAGVLWNHGMPMAVVPDARHQDQATSLATERGMALLNGWSAVETVRRMIVEGREEQVLLEAAYKL